MSSDTFETVIPKHVVYRAETMIKHDIDESIADTLAEITTADLHKIIDAKEHGCTDNLLLKIFGN